jgi:hypothetical protein
MPQHSVTVPIGLYNLLSIAFDKKVLYLILVRRLLNLLLLQYLFEGTIVDLTKDGGLIL